MKEMLWILIWSFGFPVGFAFGLWFEERSKRKQASRKRSRQRFIRSVEYAGRRLMIEDSIRRILHEPVNITKPIRKVCGVLASEDAQKLWEA